MIQGFIITGIGMGLVFVMIIALWGIMALLTALTSKAAEEEAAQAAEEAAENEAAFSEEQASDLDSEVYALGAATAAMAAAQDSQKAAAIAVAYALAKEKGGQFRPYSLNFSDQITSGSQWLNAGRTQQTLRIGR